MKLQSPAALLITDSLFQGNTANPGQSDGGHVGGALYLEAGDANFSGCTFSGNRSNAVCTDDFFGCQAVARGGAIFTSSSGSISIDASFFVDNRADAFNRRCRFFSGSPGSLSTGAGVYIAGGTASITNAIFACNTNTWNDCNPADDGAGLFVSAGAAVLRNSTVARNSDSTGLGRSGGSLTVENSIVYLNNNSQAQFSGLTTFAYSDVQLAEGVVPGNGNINFQPVFAGIGCTTQDLRIVPGSPAIDAGNPDPQFNDACFPPSLGVERNDMGAFGGPGACNNFMP